MLPLLIILANIGDSFVANRRLDTDNERCDVRSIGSVMMELMEPHTYIMEPNSTVLRNSAIWKDAFGIEEFLRATFNRSLRELRKVRIVCFV